MSERKARPPRVREFKLYQRVCKALNEKDVENVYRELFHIVFPDSEITSPHGCDGLLKSAAHSLVALMEFKYDLDLKVRWTVCEVLAQCLYYLKKFEQAGDSIPRVLFVGDINECFCVAVGPLEKYLGSRDIDWSSAPSSAATNNPKLVKAMHEDETIVPYVWDVAELKFGVVVDKMLDLNRGIVRHVTITEANITRIFDDFCSRVVKDARYKGKGKAAEKRANELVGIFLGVLTQPGEFYLHPAKTKKNTLITPTVGELKVDQKEFATFFSHFQGEYSPAECERLVAICDRLIEDTRRRWTGAFFTPTHWVDEAHRMIERQLGADWKEQYVVWDCCWGTGNLTRDYRFKELYCSTLIPDELQLGQRYNPEAVKFQYDFLSEVGLDKLPKEAEGLKRAFAEGRKVLFLVNPPYGTANTSGTEEGKDKAGIADTAVRKSMKSCCSARQLYAQFLYKMAKLGGVIVTFAPPLFLTGGSFKSFRKFWLSQFCFSEGILFQASEFADVNGQWGIMFSVWQNK
jgi:hypothetical protein